jgi:hypothetical protein
MVAWGTSIPFSKSAPKAAARRRGVISNCSASRIVIEPATAAEINAEGIMSREQLQIRETNFEGVQSGRIGSSVIMHLFVQNNHFHSARRDVYRYIHFLIKGCASITRSMQAPPQTELSN